MHVRLGRTPLYYQIAKVSDVLFFSQLDSFDLKFLHLGPTRRTSEKLADKPNFQEVMLSIFAWMCYAFKDTSYSEDEDSDN